MEKKIAALALLLYGPFFAFAEEGTANSFPGIDLPIVCDGALQSTEIVGTVYAAKASDSVWANGTACGKKYCVLCESAADPSLPSPCRKNSYAAIIIHAYCPDCGATFSISRPGFAAIVDPNAADIVKINYALVDNVDLPCA